MTSTEIGRPATEVSPTPPTQPGSAKSDLAATVSELQGKGVRFRNQIITGVGGRQIMAEDPSGNPVDLFVPGLPEARLS